MNPSLYEMLTLNFSDELPIEQVNQKDQIILSVMDNIQRILNTRRGAITHLSEYGLPDFSHVLQGLPASAHQLIENITRAIVRYEPRLRGIEVHLLPSDAIGHLSYSMILEIDQVGRVDYQSDFTPEGRVVLRHLKQQGRIDDTW
ncbi:type VI secretion system baseplate subunit TssE [Thorsellia anophelis]|uniref:Type VI secretion system protein n=1 Tax=Thorsellia anophelis DSM 18579 TaxID=1123402 RepID=A0A1I0FVP8_9GAMM|nr:type VI secretion system baseplate subunit TssE [Thorsellia anophelis]SET61548.1 type VI secretion system protein [Thorsellia anophelis DSM 18579]